MVPRSCWSMSRTLPTSARQLEDLICKSRGIATADRSFFPGWDLLCCLLLVENTIPDSTRLEICSNTPTAVWEWTGCRFASTVRLKLLFLNCKVPAYDLSTKADAPRFSQASLEWLCRFRFAIGRWSWLWSFGGTWFVFCRVCRT